MICFISLADQRITFRIDFITLSVESVKPIEIMPTTASKNIVSCLDITMEKESNFNLVGDGLVVLISVTDISNSLPSQINSILQFLDFPMFSKAGDEMHNR